MTQNRHHRIRVIAGGAVLMVACCLAAYAMVLLVSLANVFGGRMMILFLLPLTAFATLLTGIMWIRRMRASATEAWASLLIVEVAILALIASQAGGVQGGALDFWILASLPVAPWWLLAMIIGPVHPRNTPRR